MSMMPQHHAMTMLPQNPAEIKVSCRDTLWYAPLQPAVVQIAVVHPAVTLARYCCTMPSCELQPESKSHTL